MPRSQRRSRTSGSRLNRALSIFKAYARSDMPACKAYLPREALPQNPHHFLQTWCSLCVVSLCLRELPSIACNVLS